MKKSDQHVPAERVAYWRSQIEQLEAMPPGGARKAMLDVARERLAIWERRASLRTVEGGANERRRGVA